MAGPRLRWRWSPSLGRSLSTRVAFTLAIMLVIMLVLVGVFVSWQMRTQLFEDRKATILNDATVRISQVQGQLDQSTASSPDQVGELVAQVVAPLRQSAAGAGAVSVMLFRSPNAVENVIINEYLSEPLEEVVTEEIRVGVNEGEPHWQSVAIPLGAEAATEPGIVVGSLVDLPLAGPYELFIVYSLGAEENTILLVLQILGVASVPLLGGITIATFALIYRMLRPVRSTARAVTQLAEGDLESRVEVHGKDEMAQLGRAFNDMAGSLQTQISEYDHLSLLQQRFVSDVSHELRTPLTTIRMAEEMIYDDRQELGPVSKRSAELLHSEVSRLEVMLADLLEISRYDAQSTQLEWETTDLYSLAERVVAANQELADHLGVKVTLGPRPERATASVDARKIERAVRNLLVNAYEHAEGNPVEVTVASGISSVAIRVKDSGVGMSEETIERIFDRFFRADPSRTRTTGGTGLGLAITKEDMAAHAGAITVKSALGRGSSFVLTVPRHVNEEIRDFPLSGGQSVEL